MTAPHMIVNDYKNVLAVAVATEYSFPQADRVKQYLEVNTSSICVHLIVLNGR